MTTPQFNDFQTAFFALLETPQFEGQTFLQYSARHKNERMGDEAAVVDNAIMSPLLALLGYEGGEQVYNAQKHGARPDFAPRLAQTGDCFIVEDKATGLDLTLELNNPKSNLAQLAGYVRSHGLPFGLLCNGRRLMLWRFDGETARAAIDLDIIGLLTLRRDHQTLPQNTQSQLRDLFDTCHREAFLAVQKLENELAVEADTWQKNAMSLSDNKENEANLILDLQELVKALQRDARHQLDSHLDRANEYSRLEKLADDKGTQTVAQLLAERREAITPHLALALHNAAFESDFDNFLADFRADPRPFPSISHFLNAALELFNRARTTPHPQSGKVEKPIKSLEQYEALHNALERFAETVLAVHARQTRLRQSARVALRVQDDFLQWRALVAQTMLGGMDEDEQRAEFALQAAYVVFIRLLLIRVCEDKGIFPDRFLSNGGLKFWQECIKRYLRFANGNPYEPLLKMAYDNAANIYAHFFTGRELFNWYRLDKKSLLEALHRLVRYDFAGVDSDLVGTVYNAYVSRHEKKKQGQYYTPPVIVDFILDETNWRDKNMISDAKRLLDPACGSGTFLVRAARRLVDAYRNEDGSVEEPHRVLERVRDKLFGFDLNPFACYLAEVNLLIQVLDVVKAALDAGESPSIGRFHIYNVDALAKAGRGALSLSHDSLLAEELDVVEAIKSRQSGTIYAGGFSHIVANPPYGAKLTDDYKTVLKRDYAHVFRGQPDTYVFFFALALGLLSEDGKLGFITPNTFLMGTNTDVLRRALLSEGRIERVVDLPSGIWPDATVDCVLLFLARERDEAKRRAQTVPVNLMSLRDDLGELTKRQFAETIEQAQAAWLDDSACAMDIRRDDLQIAIEKACLVEKKINEMEFAPAVQRLGDVTDSSQGIIPYFTREEGRANLYVKPQRDVQDNAPEWKPLLDTSAFVGRYEVRWGAQKPFLKYGDWLYTSNVPKFYDSPKIVLVRFRNRSLSRRLVATYDESGFYTRENFNTIIADESKYNLKYILALFNSSLLNYWYRKRNDQVSINPTQFRTLPIFPADEATQNEIARRVDELLNAHRVLNAWREAGYSLKTRNGAPEVSVPFDALLEELQNETPVLDTLRLFDARHAGLFSLPAECDQSATISGAKISGSQVSLRYKRLWLEVQSESAQRFLAGYLSRPRWIGKTFPSIQNDALMPADETALRRFFAKVEARTQDIESQMQHAADLDRALDERVLDLYGIAKPEWRARVLGTIETEEIELAQLEEPRASATGENL